MIVNLNKNVPGSKGGEFNCASALIHKNLLLFLFFFLVFLFFNDLAYLHNPIGNPIGMKISRLGEQVMRTFAKMCARRLFLPPKWSSGSENYHFLLGNFLSASSPLEFSSFRVVEYDRVEEIEQSSYRKSDTGRSLSVT